MSRPEPTASSPQTELPPPPRRRWLGRALAVLLVAALGGSAWWLVQRAKNPTAGAPPSAGARGGGPAGGGGGPGGGAGGAGSVTVGVARARQGELPVIIEALGTVTPVTSIVLRPQVSGILTQVLFTEGQSVQKGQLLARIDPRPFEQALAQSQGQRARDEAQLAAARVTLGRYQTLWKQDSIARQDVDTQAALVKQLEGTLQTSRASEQAAKLNVDYSRITAPISGTIGLRAVDPGNMVNAGGTTGIATITQMAPIDVQFAVPQDRVPDVLAAQRAKRAEGGALPVTALDRTRDDVLGRGRFSTLDNVIDAATGTLRAKARFDNAERQLFPNQFVNVRLQLGATPGVLVPVTAVRTGPQGDYVYVVDEDRTARMRLVKRGGATVDQVLIASGVQAGDTVVTEGGDRVKDGGRVQLAGERPMRGASGAGAARSPRGGASGAAASASGAAGGAPAAATAATAGAGAPPRGAGSAASGAEASSARSAPESGAARPPADAAPTPASAASRPAWLDRLPPELRERVLAMPPEERRAFLQQLRERRAQREAQGGGQ